MAWNSFPKQIKKGICYLISGEVLLNEKTGEVQRLNVIIKESPDSFCLEIYIFFHVVNTVAWPFRLPLLISRTGITVPTMTQMTSLALSTLPLPQEPSLEVSLARIGLNA